MAQRAVCLGEVMLWLGAPGHQRLAQAGSLDVHVARAEANVDDRAAARRDDVLEMIETGGFDVCR